MDDVQQPGHSDTEALKGHCLCGAVSVELVRDLPVAVGVCHCRMCRRWGGGPLFALESGPDTHFVEVQPNALARYASSDWAERGFCRQCGTHLFYRLVESGVYEIPVGLFDPDSPFELHQQIFVDEKPVFYALANHTRMLTGEEVFATAQTRD